LTDINKERYCWLTARFTIRRDARAGMSARAIEREDRVARRTVVKAVASAWPEPRLVSFVSLTAVVREF
jgi:hypothetical protein